MSFQKPDHFALDEQTVLSPGDVVQQVFFCSHIAPAIEVQKGTGFSWKSLKKNLIYLRSTTHSKYFGAQDSDIIC